MALLNYSTSIDVHKTLGEIQKTLVEHGARKLHGEKGIRLPANVEPVYKVLQQQKNNRKISVKVDYDQALRVAWRIIKTWVDAQMAILETEMVKMEEIFLPYMLDNRGQTFFQAFEQKQLTSGE